MFIFLRGSLMRLQISLYSAELFFFVKTRLHSCHNGLLQLVPVVLTDCTFLLKKGSCWLQFLPTTWILQVIVC